MTVTVMMTVQETLIAMKETMGTLSPFQGALVSPLEPEIIAMLDHLGCRTDLIPRSLLQIVWGKKNNMFCQSEPVQALITTSPSSYILVVTVTAMMTVLGISVAFRETMGTLIPFQDVEAPPLEPEIIAMMGHLH